MKHQRIPKRKAAVAGAAVVALGTAAVLLPNAGATQSGPDTPALRQFTPPAASELSARLADRLGQNFGGAYYDSDERRVVVNVAGNDDTAADQVRAAGAVVRSVEHSVTELKAASSTLKAEATIPGTSWAVDPVTNEIRVTADRTVKGADWDRLKATVAGLGADMARIERAAGEFTPFASGGDAILGGGARCSLGFNVTTRDGAPGFLTAGHCGVATARWTEANGTPLGTIQEATFPGSGDLAVASYDDPAAQAPSVVAVGQGRTVAIRQALDATVGQEVSRMGSTTGLHEGRVTGLNATVNYAEGTVSGLVQTDVCAEPGDSGGPLFTRDGGAVGLTSGGSGDCAGGGITFFQPVTTALTAFGATLGDGGSGQQPPTDPAPPQDGTTTPPEDGAPGEDDD
ncbi:S1 family peptidase [Streptomyces uncialis]|uniref:S1 family peptidase n=1 Tax=Streptomyces uncialis TaxID=1048205 RepID=UPI002E2F6C95|nr:S1 family peptidase [Streptomyces uncialis]